MKERKYRKIMEKMRENEGKIDNGEHIVRNQYKLLFARRRLKGIKHVLPDDPDELRAYKQRIRENWTGYLCACYGDLL